MEPQVDPLVGHTLGGRYRIERLLGRGGAGAVYEATQLDLLRKVAIKTLRPELATDSVLLERFRREARAAASLGHPHIAQVLDWGDPSATEPAFIAFELVGGDSLLELLRREKLLSPERAAGLMSQILSALETAHRAGIVHRDLKPGNIMVTKVPGLGESAKLLDFGIAQIKGGEAYQRLTQTGMILGTPRYMSPEQLRGAPTDARTDLWAAGVVLHRMLAGTLPFVGAPNDVVMAVLTAPVPPIAKELGVPPALEAVVTRALEKSPANRWPSAAAMFEALESAMRAPPVLVRTSEMPAVHAGRLASELTEQGVTRVVPSASTASLPSLPPGAPSISNASMASSGGSMPPAAPSMPSASTSTSAFSTPVSDASMPAAPARARAALLPWVLAATGAGGCLLFAALAAILAMVGNVGSLFSRASGLPAPGGPVSESGSPWGAVSSPFSGDVPLRGTLASYLAIAEETVHSDDPSATLDGVYLGAVEEDGTVVIDAAHGAMFVFRGSDGRCLQVVLQTDVAPATETVGPTSCSTGPATVLPTLPPEEAITRARVLCPLLASTPAPLGVYFTPFTGLATVMVSGQGSHPMFNGLVLPDGSVGPMPYVGYRCTN